MEYNARKTTGLMASTKNEFEYIANLIRNIENQIDDDLKKSLSKSSNLIKYNGILKELILSTQIISDISQKNPQDLKFMQNLMSAIKSCIYELRSLLMKDIQKTMLKTVENLADAESGLMLIKEVQDIYGMFLEISNKMEGNY